MCKNPAFKSYLWQKVCENTNFNEFKSYLWQRMCESLVFKSYLWQKMCEILTLMSLNPICGIENVQKSCL